MTDRSSSTRAVAAIRSHTGAIVRHGMDGRREFVCLATRIGTGLWASVWDRGAYGGTVYGDRQGTRVLVDLHLHAFGSTDDGMPVQWATQTAFRPIMIFAVPSDASPAPIVAPTAEMCFPEYQRIHRPHLEGAERFQRPSLRSETDTTASLGAVVGHIHGAPCIQRYRSGSDDAHRFETTCIEAAMDYPSDVHLGGPVVDDFGRLAGIIVGAGMGPQYDHVGAYVPVDMLAAHVDVARAAWAEGSGSRHSLNVDRVEHRSSDVLFHEEDRPRDSTRYPDQPVKIVLPLRDWSALVGILLDDLHGETPTTDGDHAAEIQSALSEITDAYAPLLGRGGISQEGMIPITLMRRRWKAIVASGVDFSPPDSDRDAGPAVETLRYALETR